MTFVVAVLGLSVWGVSPASAMSQNCSSSHCYSIAYSGVTNATGALITNIHANNMHPGGVSSSTPYFITSEEWLQTTDASSWVEAGIVDGYGFNLGKQVYALFTYAHGASTGYDSGWWYINYTSPTGATHTFQISRAATTNRFSVWADGVTSVPDFTTGNVGFWQAEPVVGGECYCNSSSEHADTFNIYHSYVTTSGSIVAWPTSGRSFSIHAGMHGQNESAYWAWNAL